jgi:hypothetical protein
MLGYRFNINWKKETFVHSQRFNHRGNGGFHRGSGGKSCNYG